MKISVLESVLSGIIQGITEFFPVSSSGHLVIVHSFFGMEKPKLFFDIVLHVGTLLAVMIYLRKEIIRILTTERKTIFFILAGTVPAVAAALLFEDRIESFFNSVRLVAVMLFVTGIWLFLGEAAGRLREKKAPLSGKPGIGNAVFIGLAQAVSLVPGISRSGSTISSGIMSGLKREEAFRFSFLLSIPAIAGAALYKLKDFNPATPVKELGLYLLGGLTAFITGLLTLRLLFALLKKKRLYYFGIYCILVSVFAFILGRG